MMGEGLQRLLLISVVLLSFCTDNVFAQYKCKDPDGYVGICKNIFECRSIIMFLESGDPSPRDRDFIKSTQCPNGGEKNPHVCCANNTRYERYRPRPGSSDGNVLPQPHNCGFRTLENRIYNGTDTSLDAYPWMVLLQYRSGSNALIPNCGGSLINRRYVVTAAHCVIGDIDEAVGQLVAVILGEYDVTKDIDCIDNDCNDPVKVIGIEDMVVHPNFNLSSNNFHNDIALLRLSEPVQYTTFIKPICLPLPNNRRDITTGESMVVAGWGRTLQARTSNIKQELTIPVNSQDYCRMRFRSRRVEIVNTQFCAGGEFSRDACNGDSGGPMMRLANQTSWFLEGVVSFGHKCGLLGWPGVYTRVSEYTAWIQNTVQP